MNNIVKKIQKFVGLILLLASIFLIFNNTYYQHKHILKNGTTIFHSHPFSKSQEKNSDNQHKHNTSEFFLISMLNNIFLTISFLIFSFFLIFRNKTFTFLKYQEHIILIFLNKYTNLRGPPII